MAKEKDQYWNILKGLGIIAVVIGHANSPLVGYVYMYHLALFFFISGYWYNDKYSLEPAKYVGKRVLSLYIPYVVYNVLFLVLHNPFFKIGLFTDVHDVPGIYPTVPYTKDIAVNMINDMLWTRGLDPLGSATWFYIALFSALLLFFGVRFVSLKLFNSKDLVATAISTIGLYVVGFWLNSEGVRLSFYIEVALVVIPIIFVGFILRKKKITVPLNWWMSILSFCILYIILKYRGQVEMSQRQFLGPLTFLACSFAGIYINMYIGKIIKKSGLLTKIFNTIGEASSTVMVFHLLCFKLIDVIQVYYYGLPAHYIAKFPLVSGEHGWWILYTIVGVGVPVAFRIIILRCKGIVTSLFSNKDETNQVAY